MIGFSFCYGGVQYTNLTLKKTGETVREEAGKVYTREIYALGDLKILRAHTLYKGGFERSWLFLYQNKRRKDNRAILSPTDKTWGISVLENL